MEHDLYGFSKSDLCVSIVSGPAMTIKIPLVLQPHSTSHAFLENFHSYNKLPQEENAGKEYRTEGGHTQKAQKAWRPHLRNNAQPGTQHRAGQEMGMGRTV